MECECKLTESQLLIIKTKSGKIRSRVCPVHKKPVDYRLTYCLTCGELVKQRKCGILSNYCEKDRKIHHIELVKQNHKKYGR
jgi:hypothetical protein